GPLLVGGPLPVVSVPVGPERAGELLGARVRWRVDRADQPRAGVGGSETGRFEGLASTARVSLGAAHFDPAAQVGEVEHHRHTLGGPAPPAAPRGVSPGGRTTPGAPRRRAQAAGRRGPGWP